ncbi:MAG: ComEA family DNA-binding protein [Gemmatimonadota bacterium]
MSPSEVRALRRAAALLLAASMLRWGWSFRKVPEAGPGPEVLSALLDTSRQELEEERLRARPLGVGEKLDPNGASESQLDRLPGVGPAVARAIVEHRTSAGQFQVPDDLLRVRGIGPATLKRIRPHLSIQGAALRGAREVGNRAARVNVNRAGEADLQRLPGIGPALAGRILAERKKRPFRSVKDLERVRGIGPATAARLRGRVVFDG